MNDELDELRKTGYKPVVVGPQPFSLDDICGTSTLRQTRRRNASWPRFTLIAAIQSRSSRPNEPNCR